MAMCATALNVANCNYSLDELLVILVNSAVSRIGRICSENKLDTIFPVLLSQCYF